MFLPLYLYFYSFFCFASITEVGPSHVTKHPIHAEYPIIMETGKARDFFIAIKEILKLSLLSYNIKVRVSNIAFKKRGEFFTINY